MSDKMVNFRSPDMGVIMINARHVKHIEYGGFWNGQSVTEVVLGDVKETRYKVLGSLHDVGKQLSDGN